MEPAENTRPAQGTPSPAPEAPTPKKEWKLTKSWQYLLYIYLLLPGVLFLLAYLLKETSFGVSLAGMFHNYGLFITNPIPNFSPFNLTGIIGVGLVLFFLGWAVKRRDWADLVLSLVLVAANFAYFLLEWNYQVIRLLRFVNNASGLF